MLEAVTKAGSAYRALRRAIVVGDIAANTALDEGDLTARFNAGRTPIREALKRLALEQFVVWPPRRTPYVREISAHDLNRLYEARLLLEEPVARLAASRITDAGLELIRATCDELDAAAAAGDGYEAVELDHQLHLSIALQSDNRFLTEAIGTLNCGSLRLWYVALQQLGLEEVSAHHRDLVEALHSRDPQRAAAETRKHILVSHERQMRLHSLTTATV